MSRTINQDSVVAVVGGAGFLGSHLVNYLINEKHCQVIVIDNLVTGLVEFINPKAKFIWHDITRSEQQLYNIFRNYKVNFVFNYAAEPYIPVSFKRPLHVADVNFMGALKVINAAQESGCIGILQVSSAEIYGDAGFDAPQNGFHVDSKLDESALVRPHSSYGATKAAIDSMIQVRWREAWTPCIALRQFNCVGERETHPYIVPEIISQIHKQMSDNRDSKGPIEVHLGNNSFRDFQYAGDAVRMAVELLEKGQFGEVYNIGSEGGTQIYGLAHMIGEIMGANEITIIEDPSRVRPWEIWHLQSDNTKLYNTIESRPEVNLPDALRRTVADFYSSWNRWSWQ